MTLKIRTLFCGAGGDADGAVEVQSPAEKACRICNETKPLDQFSKRPKSSRNDGYRSDCKACVVKRTSGRDRREYLAAYYLAHPEKYVGQRGPDAAYHRRYRAENPERIKAISQRSITKNKAARVVRNHERRAMPMDDATRQYVALLLAGPCSYCLKPAATIDHIVPLVDRGTNDWWNLTGACKRCNSSKGPRSLLRFLLTSSLNAA